MTRQTCRVLKGDILNRQRSDLDTPRDVVIFAVNKEFTSDELSRVLADVHAHGSDDLFEQAPVDAAESVNLQ